MDSQHTHAKPFRFTDPRQQRIHDRLSLLGPGPVDFYRAACRLLAMQPPLEATTHLVGHLLREIESALRAVVRVVAEHTEQPRPRGEPDKHKRDILAILKGLGIAETDAIAYAWLGIAGQENSYGLVARAHRDALNAPRPVNTSFRTCWDDMECILDVVLAKFETRFLHSLSLLDTLLSIPSPGLHDAEKLRNQVPNNLVTLGY